MKKKLGLAALVAAALSFATPAWAPFHLLVIEQVFFGTDNLPQAQFVVLRTLTGGQIFVAGRDLNLQNADSSGAGKFGTFTKNYIAHAGPDVAMIAGTQEAQDLFCLPMDQIVDGSLVFPDGRVCFSEFDYGDGLGTRPVDCVAYGAYQGDNEPYLPPAMAPQRNLSLVRVAETDNNQNDFDLLPPMPQNNPGAVGEIDGTPGDADGSGTVTAEDVDLVARLAFAVAKRCDVTMPDRRGADANIDTRVNAADVIATGERAVHQAS